MMRTRGIRGGWLALWLTACLAVSGCPVVLVGAGAVVGYAVSRDHVELVVERPYAQVWSTALEETKRVGLIQDLDEDRGRIEAAQQGTHIQVTVEQVTETAVKIVIKARKHLLPKIDVAQRLASRIARRLG